MSFQSFPRLGLAPRQFDRGPLEHKENVAFVDVRGVRKDGCCYAIPVGSQRQGREGDTVDLVMGLRR
ncbi:unnamed protein product [Linum trigynum]|uniref:Uncharacterized protein n=1 Tax=Linum trigynum TaxID=586398 RepID=A0AAV2GKY2_9ROSI